MKLEYMLLDTSYKPTPDVEAAIQADLRRVNERLEKEERGLHLIYLVNGAQFEEPITIHGARVLGYLPLSTRIYNTDGEGMGYHNLSEPLEALTEEQLVKLSRQGTLLRLDMLVRLKGLADQKIVA